MIGSAALLGGTVAYLTGSWIYALTVAWALFGLVIVNTARTPNKRMAVLSGAMIPVVGVACALGVLK